MQEPSEAAKLALAEMSSQEVVQKAIMEAIADADRSRQKAACWFLAAAIIVLAVSIFAVLKLL